MNVKNNLMTWQLWRMLKRPPVNNPIFEQYHKSRNTLRAQVGNGILIVLTGVLIALQPAFMLTVILASPVMFLFLAGTVMGTLWSMRISSTILRQRRQGNYELMATTPGGELWANWALCAGSLHRNRGFLRVYHRLLRLFKSLLILVTVVAFSVFMVPYYLAGDVIIIVFMLLTGLAAAYVDYVQSIVLSSLIGISVSLHARQDADARLLAVGAFLGLQVLVYLLTLLAGLAIFPGMKSLIADLNTRILVLIILWMGAMVSLRELLFMVLWQHVARRLNLSQGDSQSFFQPQQKA